MKKLESSLKNMLLVLTGVTAISVALLAYVNELTKEPIAQANAKTLSDAVSAVVPGFDNDPIAEKKMQEVNGVQYSVYPATKGGEYIGAADWFKKGNKGDITGMNPGEAALTVSKDGGKVDAITASTITSRAFLNAVNAAYAAYAGQETADGTTGATQKNVEQPADSAAPEAVDTLSAK